MAIAAAIEPAARPMLPPAERGGPSEEARCCDALARLLAAQAGFRWDSLHNHPGFLRERFRESAQAVIDQLRGVA